WAWACGWPWLPLEALEALEDRDRVARAHLNDRLLPRPRATGGDPAALGLGLDRQRAHLDDLDVEQRLDGLADLRLVGVGVDAERVLVVGGEHVALLADDRADDDLAVIHVSRPPPRRRRSSRPWRASSAGGAPPRWPAARPRRRCRRCPRPWPRRPTRGRGCGTTARRE